MPAAWAVVRRAIHTSADFDYVRNMVIANGAVAAGIAYLSEDRKRYGLALKMDVETNIVLATFRRFLGALGWVDTRATRDVSRHHVEALSIKTPGLGQKVQNLSGGNQQKVVLARWLSIGTRIFILDEPTRGIDVGSKSEIYQIMDRLTKEGVGIIMISSELPEVLGMSDRIMVMRQGRIVKELARAEASEETIMKYAVGSEGAVA